jgi:hypothetical protein
MPFMKLLALISGRSFLLGSLAVLGATAASAQSTPPTAPGAVSGWQFVITPYAWVPSVDGTLRYGLPPGSTNVRSADVAVDSGSVLEAINFAAMLKAEARHGAFSVLTDLIYLDMGNAKSGVRSVDFVQAGSNPVSSSLNAGTESSLRGTMVTLAGGYTVLQGSWGHLDLLGGLRYFGLKARTDVRLGADVVGPGGGQVFAANSRLSDRVDLLDGIVGARGRIMLGAGFHIPYGVDIGTGSSRLTWQAETGIGYQTGWAGVTLGYRHLAYEQGGDDLVQDLSFSGPFLAGNFRF